MVASPERCCKNCVHFMLGFYRATQTIPGDVCNLREKKMEHMKEQFPKRKWYYKAYPNRVCEHFDKWIQPSIDEIYGRR